MTKESNYNIEKEIYNNLEIHKCVSCYDAPCNRIYKNISPEKIIRAIKFDNKKGARTLIQDEKNCLEKNNKCKEKCPLNVDIDGIITNVINQIDKIEDFDNIDISSEICGIKLENPFLLSSSIVGSRYEMCKRAFEKGWAGVVTKTISMMSICESSPRLSALKNFDESFVRI